MTAQRKTQTTQAKTRATTRRKSAPSASTASESPRRSRQRKSKQGSSNKGARVILILAIVGGVIGSIFVVAQKFQISTLQLKRTEESLKSEIDTLASQQRLLNYEKEKALSAQETKKAADEFGLVQSGVGGRKVAEPTTAEPKPTPKPKEQIVVKNAKAPVRQSGKLGKNAKVVPVKVAKSGKAIPAKSTKKPVKQVAKAQAPKKGARR